MKDNKIKPKRLKTRVTTPEVFHLFANQIQETAHSSNYNFLGDSLYYNNSLIAKIYDAKKKIVLIKEFDYSNRYNNGYASNTIARVFDDKWTKYIINDLVNVNINSEQVLKNKLFKSIIDKYIDKIVDIWYWKNELLTNNRKQTGNYQNTTIEDLQKQLLETKRKLKIPAELFKVKYDRYSVQHIGYKGWTRYYKYTTLTNTPNYWLHFKFSDDELALIECKKWIHKYIYNTEDGKRLTFKQKQDLYFNVDARTEYELKVKTAQDNREKEYLIKQAKEREERKLKGLEHLKLWLDNKYVGAVWDIPIHLRLVNNVETNTFDIVQTTLGVNVPLTHAKLLYLKFKQCVRNNEEWITNGKSISIGLYKVEWIKKIEDRWALKAGCHTIYESEIDLFVKQYNLDW